MIVALLNQKGGVGKTTLALHLAGQWTRQGRRVLLIDADPQGSALDWSQQRATEGLPRLFSVVGLARDTLHIEAPELARGMDHVVIDGPPRVANLLRSALFACDLALIPVQPSPLDGWASAEMLKLIDQARIFKPEIGARFLLNRYHARNDAQAQDGFRVPARCGRCVDCRTGGRRSTNRPVATGKQRQTDDRRDAPVASTPKARGAPARRNGCRHAAYLAAPRISRWRGKRIMRTADRDDRTRVDLLWIERRIERWIRFGRLVEDQILDRRRRRVAFVPDSVFAYVRWASNDFGTLVSRIAILRAVLPGEPYQKIGRAQV